MADQPIAVSDISDTSDIRVVLYQSGKLVHAPLDALTTISIDTRAIALTSRVPTKATFIRTAGYAIVGDGGGALYKKVSAAPSHQGKFQTVDGAWWELVATTVTLEMFGGGVGKTGAQNNTAYTDLETYIGTNTISSSAYRGGVTLQLDYGTYSFASTLQIKRTMVIQGRSGADAPNPATALSFPASTTGIIIHRNNTLNDGKISPTTYGADGTMIRDIALLGGGGNQGKAPDDTHGMLGHGIWLRSRAKLENILVRGFACHGFFIRASAGSGDPAQEGNANGWKIINCKATSNGWDGMRVGGADVNAGYSLGFSASANNLWGIYDNSFLGNTHVAAQTATNGTYARVYNSGRRYHLIQDDPTGLITPGTDATVWVDIGSGSVHPIYPQWVSGNPYYRGGAYIVPGNSARGMLMNCYSEGDQSYSEIISPNMVIGGLHAAGFVNTTGVKNIDGAFSNLTDVVSAHVGLSQAATGLVELASLKNTGGRNNGRGAKVAIYAGQKDDLSSRPAGSVYAKSLGVTDPENTAVGLEYYDGTAAVFKTAIELNGKTKVAYAEADNTWALGSSALRWLAGYFTKVFVGAGATFWTSGVGTPEGAVVGPIGSLYTRTDGGAATTLYVKETGTGNTGWVAK